MLHTRRSGLCRPSIPLAVLTRPNWDGRAPLICKLLWVEPRRACSEMRTSHFARSRRRVARPPFSAPCSLTVIQDRLNSQPMEAHQAKQNGPFAGST